MRTEIYIENQQLDLYKDISAEFTYNIDDVKDFSSRNTNFSKTIVIPGNATNNKLFGHIFEFGSGNFYNPSADNVGYNFNASKSAACVVYVDKIQIFKGIIRLLEIIIDNGSIEYECAVFGELGGFVSAIANRKIEDLDFSAYNHQWTATNIINSWEQASGTTASGMGYFYPLIDYGQVSVGKHDWQYKAFRPALFVREYIDKIITGAGYTWESTFFNSNLPAANDKIHSSIFKLSNTQNNNQISEDKMDSVIRILQVRKITGLDTWKIETGTSNITPSGITLDFYGYGGHLDDPSTPTADINFGAPKEINFTLSNPYPSANLFNGYWGDYVAEISDKDSKLLTCNVRLTDIDIYNLDFSRPIWIDGSLWRLNKVMDYNPMVDDTTKCEFIKVIETTYA